MCVQGLIHACLEGQKQQVFFVVVCFVLPVAWVGQELFNNSLTGAGVLFLPRYSLDRFGVPSSLMMGAGADSGVLKATRILLRGLGQVSFNRRDKQSRKHNFIH